MHPAKLIAASCNVVFDGDVATCAFQKAAHHQGDDRLGGADDPVRDGLRRLPHVERALRR